MSRHDIRLPRAALLYAALLTLAAALAVAYGGTAVAAPAASCAGPIPGRHIYDSADLLTAAEVADLERHAAAVDQAGAPTVVYLQARDASYAQTLQGAQDLMNRWNVQSSPKAHDGFVMLLNLKPGNLRHGEVALFAGAKHYNGGNLPQSELSRIYTSVMLPLLRNGETAAGIGAGLDAVAHDLKYGPPSNPGQAVAATFGVLPYNILAVLFLVGLYLLHRWARPPLPAASVSDQTNPVLSSDLAPALVGALVTGRVRDEQIEATILDFARRGLLVLEPVGADQIQVRLLSHDARLTGYEKDVWSTLSTEADHEDVIPASRLPSVRSRWPWSKDLLRQELVRRGWYDPNATTPRRRPFYVAGAIGLLAIVMGFIVAAAAPAVAQEGWVLLGWLIFLVGTIAAFILARGVPDTSAEGQQVAAPWRSYLASIKAGRQIPDPDAALPYVVALGAAGALTRHLQAANAQGYSPAWFREDRDDRAEGASFYPYWPAFHSSMYPVSSGGTSGGGFAGGGGGGAASGGGGAGGAF